MLQIGGAEAESVTCLRVPGELIAEASFEPGTSWFSIQPAVTHHAVPVLG